MIGECNYLIISFGPIHLQGRLPRFLGEGRRWSVLTSLADRDEGQGLVEYGLIIFFVAIVVIAILMLLGPQVGSIFSSIVNAL
jgi:pilus assembly protein Flp/PilA